MNFPHFSLRTKIILSFLIIIIIGGLISLSLGFRLIKNTLISQAQVKVNHDLASAWMVFNEKLNDIKDIVSLTAARESVQEALRKGKQDILLKYLSRVREEYGLDILTLTDSNGKVIVRTRNPEVVGDNQSQDEIVKRSLKGDILAYPQIISQEELLKEGQDLAEQAYIEFIPTPKAAARPENKETSGMMLKSAYPIIDENNTLLGVLYGGILLNRNYEIVDRVKETVYKEEKYKGREIGTATIFQHDLRISTNVKNENGERAIGTRVSKEVNTAVLKEGKAWIDRAFVVNDWYITAYEPIKNINNKIIGILYVGMLERPYIDTTEQVMLTFTVMASLCVVLLLVILYFSTTRIINPLQKMVVATQEIAKGDLSHKVEVNSKDEIGYLAESFNQMTEDLKSANQKLIEWGKTLEKKVEERTKELTKMQAHLFQSEKLASLGKLSAGIAHEINNPLGGVLIYSHLLLEDTDKSSPHYENLKKIVKETSRCKNIVKGLLEFARPKDPEMSLIDINKLVDKSLSIMEGQALFQNIRVEKRYSSDLSKIVADSGQLQQVFMNIILNAAESMDGNGSLILFTSLDEDSKNISIKFTDTGQGIKEEDKKRLFEPFFSTKEVGKGTGLGLAISYSIIQKHNGVIEVHSELGKGSTFTVKLPVTKEIKHD
ncbi:MAG: HAMP domain-containing protein [Candidatus Aminicenantes bacterium]|nr:MAG: HAMP domain-containing protein [Candidatus Aminicenantes bacterium]